MLAALMHRFDGCAVMWDRASMSFSCMGTISASLRCIIQVSNYDRPIATRQVIRVITAFVSGEPDGRTAPMSSMAGKQHLRVERMSARKPQRLNTARKPWPQRRYWLSPTFREAPAAGLKVVGRTREGLLVCMAVGGLDADLGPPIQGNRPAHLLYAS